MKSASDMPRCQLHRSGERVFAHRELVMFCTGHCSSYPHSQLPSTLPPQEPKPKHVSVKEVVLPFNKFPGADTLLVRGRPHPSPLPAPF